MCAMVLGQHRALQSGVVQVHMNQALPGIFSYFSQQNSTVCDWGPCALDRDVKHHFWFPVLLAVHFASFCWLEERRRIVQTKAAYSPVTQSQLSLIF